MMQIWDKFKQPPEWAMKKITGGRLNGKSDISPMWRIQVLTEVFGPCGIGWKYEIVRTWTEEGDKGQRMIFRDINLFIKHEGNWSDAIPGTGGDMLIVMEKNGLYCNDEAAKMALTDALGNAMKNLGVAAVVYSGGMDGTKYNRPQSPTANTNTCSGGNIPAREKNAATGQAGGKKEDANKPIQFKKKCEDGSFVFVANIAELTNRQIEWYARQSANAEQQKVASDYILNNLERFPNEKPAEGQDAGSAQQVNP